MNKNLVSNGKLDREATSAAVRELLQSIIRSSHLELSVRVRTAEADATASATDAEVLVDLDGKDRDLILARNGEVLKAIEHLLLRSLGLDVAYHDKIHVDCAGYHALRLEELKVTSRVAAERVLASGQPFTLNPMNPRERRVVHLALRDVAGIRTESVGTGDERQVVIHPEKPASTPKK